MAFPREVDAGRDASSARYSAPLSLFSLNGLYLLVKTTTRRCRTTRRGASLRRRSATSPSPGAPARATARYSTVALACADEARPVGIQPPSIQRPHLYTSGRSSPLAHSHPHDAPKRQSHRLCNISWAPTATAGRM